MPTIIERHGRAATPRGPARPAVRLVVVGMGAPELHPQRVDAVVERSEQGREQGDRGEHRDHTDTAAQ